MNGPVGLNIGPDSTTHRKLAIWLLPVLNVRLPQQFPSYQLLRARMRPEKCRVSISIRGPKMPAAWVCGYKRPWRSTPKTSP